MISACEATGLAGATFATLSSVDAGLGEGTEDVVGPAGELHFMQLDWLLSRPLVLTQDSALSRRDRVGLGASAADCKEGGHILDEGARHGGR